VRTMDLVSCRTINVLKKRALFQCNIVKWWGNGNE
jgi:hypothetical protein